jgi:cob(I)alamin adenosyltransferase
MKIYTRTGDAGDTGLFGGGRVPKAHLRVEAYGSVDELNAVLGLSCEAISDSWIEDRLLRVQKDLFSLGASLATPGAEDGSAKAVTPPLPEGRIGEMEIWIDEATGAVPELRSFILPGGTRGAALLHVARTVCRRAERAVVRLSQEEGVDAVVLVFLNRLSDALFTFARLENSRAGVADVLWEADKGDDP